MTGRLRSSLGGHLVARLLFSTPTGHGPTGHGPSARRLALTAAAFALAATPALAQRGDTTGGTTGRRGTSDGPRPSTPTAEPTERRDRTETGRTETGRTETGRTDTNRGDTGRATPPRRQVVTPPRTPVVTPAETPRGRRDVPADQSRTRGNASGQATSDRSGSRDTVSRDTGSRDTGSRDTGTTGGRQTGRVDDTARRGDTAQGRVASAPRPGVVSVPRASAGSWSTPDWDRWGRDRGHTVRRSRPIIDIVWPWEMRYARAWSPRYRYRQVVYAESGWRGRGWESRYEVVTTYRQRILDASASRARLELLLDDVTLYQDGRYVGRVTRFPYDFERLRATLTRGGRVDFDRDLMVIGDARDGFELVSTRAYGGYAYASWRRGDDVRAAWLDFRSQTATFAGRSRFFDPYDYAGYAPISILPADADWLGDYGLYSASAYPYVGYGYDGGWNDRGYDRDDGYYYGYGGVRERSSATPRGATDGSDRRYETRSTTGRDATGRETVSRGSTSGEAPTLRRDSDDRYTTPGGATIRLRREAEIQRVD